MESKIFRFLGSIRLAVPLLVAIAIILIGATFYESEVGSATVQREIYKSAWFGALMFLLAVNLGISTLSRFPWKGPRKIGFALTHWGLIVIIAGSAAVIHLSTEGMLLVRTDSGPGSQIRVEGDLLEVVAPDQTRQQTDIFIKSDGSVYPRQFGGLSLLGYSDNAIKTVQFTNDGAVENLAVQVQLQSDRMGQTLERWLAVAPAAYSQMDIGPAHLELFEARDEAELQQLLQAPDAEQSPMGTLAISQIAGQSRDRAIDVSKALGQTLALSPDLSLTVANVWPDFRLGSDGQPTSASDQYRNPAVQLVVTQGELQERWFVFGKAGLPPVRSDDQIALALTYEPPAATPTDYFRLVAAPNHQLFYAAASSKGFKSGEFLPEQSVTPGWADFEISLAQQLDHAQVQRQIVPVMPVAQGAVPAEGSPALHVATADGQDFWLPWGEPTELDTPNGEYFAAFTPKLLELPFYVKLNDFIVERNEGSESVAMWTSDITLFDAQTDTAVQRSVWMNHPTWFRGWKLAQASWNPGDLQQSTLQLKREPWWVTALTWTGSLLVVIGIVVMFYGPSLVKRWRRWTRSPQPESEPTVEENSGEKAVGTIPILAVFGK
ncbi:cytochrome c biogenesis protein ResB [Leptolyngbya iicbica]|uniref:Cytochrome C biogenesis protein n=2 Tax=Cyanophyceae TaxID=3028117 RepID=A0A4Q7EJM7_9CYAN|nr:cytochrome c biogenesis protein ResB [Leptolyngbya sp. LK]RZM82009.1 cytochrome C biogenesis protein [Leptolyngbya sp. LK]